MGLDIITALRTAISSVKEWVNDTKAPSVHPHTITDITELPLTLSTMNESLQNKADLSHSHDMRYDPRGSASAALDSAKEYTQSQIDALVGEGASDTLDTIGEISAAITDNHDAIDILNEAIAKKSNTGHYHIVSGYTPVGTISEHSIILSGSVSSTFSGSENTHGHTFTGAENKHKHDFTGTKATISTEYTPVGSVSSEFTGTSVESSGALTTQEVASSTHKHLYTPEGTVSQPAFTGKEATISANYTPSGTVSQPSFTGDTVASSNPSKSETVYSITNVGSAPSMTASVVNKCLVLSFNAGNVPTREQVVVSSSEHTHDVTATGTVSQPTFNGSQATISTTYTPEGTVSTPTFIGTESDTTSIQGIAEVASAEHKHNVVASGTIKSGFSGTKATLSAEYTPEGSISEASITPAGLISNKTITPEGSVTSSFSGAEIKHSHTFNGTTSSLSTGTDIYEKGNS